MKSILFAGLTGLALASCTFETSSTTENGENEKNTEIKSDVEIISNGLECAEIFLSNDEGERIKSNLTFGEKVQMNYSDVKGMEVVDGAIRADIMFLFRTLAGDTVLYINYGDLQEQDFEIEDKDHVDFNVFSPITSPVYSGQKYIFNAGFRDVRTGNTLEGETEIKVNPNYDIDVAADEMTYKEIYLYDATQETFITNQKVKLSSKNEFRIREIQGFNLIGENALIGASLLLKNDKDETVLNIADLAEGMPNGMPFSDISEALVVDFTIGSENPTSYATVEVVIWDKNGEGKIVINTKLEIEE